MKRKPGLEGGACLRSPAGSFVMARRSGPKPAWAGKRP